jgi:hypothetical protein
MDRPVISFLTDFGPESAPAICRGVMLSIARDAQIVDISHSIRKFAIRDGAYLLWSTVPWLPVAVHVAVVDPGVGTARRPIAIRVQRGDILVGPDNGVLVPAAAALGGATEARAIENRELMLPRISRTFHGRDVFAPVAAHLAMGSPFERVGPVVGLDSLVDLVFPAPSIRDGGLEATVAYVDGFGNIRIHATSDDLAAALGGVDLGRLLNVEFPAEDGGPPAVERAAWASTFGDRPPGAALLYEDSSGLLALAENQGDAARRLGIQGGRRVRIHSASS